MRKGTTRKEKGLKGNTMDNYMPTKMDKLGDTISQKDTNYQNGLKKMKI